MEINKDEESREMGHSRPSDSHPSEQLTVAVPKTAQVMWSGESLAGHSPQQTSVTCFLPEDSMESSMYMMRPAKRRHIQEPVDSACRVLGSCSSVLVWLLSSRTIVEEYPQSSLVEACEAYAARHEHTHNTQFKLVLIEDVQMGVEAGKLTVRILGNLVRDLPAAVLVRVPTPTIQSDSELTVLRHLEMMGMRLINPSRGIFDCANKFWTFQRLAGHGIPLPDTLSYGGLATKVPAVAEQLEKSGAVQFPAVMKNVRGHRGKNVWLGKSREEVVTDIQGMPHCTAPYLFQHYVKESHGKDVRVIVIGDQVFGAMYRQAPDDRLCSNCSQGGSGTPYNLPEDAKAMCVRIAKILNMDIIGIDLLFQNGSFVVCEANPNVGYKAFDKCYNISVGASIAEYAFGRAMENLHVLAPHIEGSFVSNVATVVPLPAALPPVAALPV